MPKPKESQSPALRQPKKKKTLGLKVPPPLRMPHQEIIKPEVAQNTSVVQDTRLVQEQASGWQNTNLVQDTNPVHPTSPVQSTTLDLWAAIPDVKGHTRFWHQLIDYLYAMLDPYEQAVYTQLFRLSWGYGRPTCFISNPRLAERANLKEAKMRRAIRSLVKKNLVVKEGYKWGSNKEQGIIFRMVLPDRLVQYTSLVQDTSLVSDTPIKENIHENKVTQRGVRVGSRFTLEDCSRYAKHLRDTGQGIKNWQGYAKSIYKSGEDDAKIEAWLTPALDISQCPTCGGSGWRYPDISNPNVGVTKCAHEALKG
jgi:hypothetical protein